MSWRSTCSRSSPEMDVLVSTTIIESGLDIPEANTLIIERADALGLAQLYQIRGRGAKRRPCARVPLLSRRPGADAGSAACLATLPTTRSSARACNRHARSRNPWRGRSARRGAVGTRCGGRLRAYVELLGEAVAELAGTRSTAARPVRVEAQIDAFVPSDYIRGEAQKIDLHRRSHSPSRRTSSASCGRC